MGGKSKAADSKESEKSKAESPVIAPEGSGFNVPPATDAETANPAEGASIGGVELQTSAPDHGAMPPVEGDLVTEAREFIPLGTEASQAPSSEAALDAALPPVRDTDEIDSERLFELLKKPAVRAFFAKHEADAATVLRNGPDGLGWKFSESKRQEAEDLAETLRLLNQTIGLEIENY